MERKTNIDSFATLKSRSGSESIAERRVPSSDGVGDRIGFGPLRRPRLLHSIDPGARRSGGFLMIVYSRRRELGGGRTARP
jgi:hypothetical protein